MTDVFTANIYCKRKNRIDAAYKHNIFKLVLNMCFNNL